MMFNHLGLFKNVLCPEGDRCGLLNCIFSHTNKECIPRSVVPPPLSTPVSDAVSPAASMDDEPLRKRRRIEGAPETRIPNGKEQEQISKSRGNGVVKELHENPNRPSHGNSRNLISVTRTVSPPTVSRRVTASTAGRLPRSTPSNTAKQNGDTHPQRQIKKEPLNPRHIARPPASHTVRMSILTKLHDAMVQLNQEVIKKNDSSKQALILSADELVAMALDEEEEAAKEHSSVYANVIKLRIAKLRKMARDEWENNVSTYIVAKFGLPAGNKKSEEPDGEISTGLNNEEEISLLSKLHASREHLDKAGYVTAAPTNDEIEVAKRGAEAAQGWEQCERCNGRFQVFPGRREDGLLATGGPCTYHHSRPLRPLKKKTDQITGHKESYYPCCNETIGTSSGCTKAKWHVFKVSEVKRLAAVLQFKETPRQSNKPTLPPVCFDCEMGYTTLGLELIRLTAISWPEGKTLLDILVKPIGEILDLNSRYSGVRPEHFINASPHDASSSTASPTVATSPTIQPDSQQTPQPSSDENNASQSQALRVVDSPSTARDLLFQLLQPETPLIGHALENDLNACRIIHPTIVDTALLYPHPGGLPYRFGLRALTRKFLNRHIQAGGGEVGHDSLEDAKATGDLVRLKIRETWRALQRVGYSFEKGRLVAPLGGGVKDGVATGQEKGSGILSGGGGGSGVLGRGAGTKRKEGEEGVAIPGNQM
ncbi:RNA exonuclease Rex3 [Blastomyces gilchristii SLH14081]|uniref:RNA exonuclease Rex3 n=1 Tax=Blastomyces gilchristii (strain SLH14081) TaxID=559298 RepID=A0A179UWT4_BLAGS|nr:RNA exonuclease Rex3 [Blastomyces gilchristii SLH14081]OAT12556.1 RNA exonuclease Rex3 [Blastomyces gilchristii SLH14081]